MKRTNTFWVEGETLPRIEYEELDIMKMEIHQHSVDMELKEIL